MFSTGNILRMVACLVAGLSPSASALTLGLDFVTTGTSDIFGVGTTTANYSGYGFIGMTTAEIQQALLDAVIEDFRGYPTVGANGFSPLQNGLGLNINFALSTNQSAPLNGDMEYYFIAMGTGISSYPFLGQACLGCVRNAGLTPASVSVGALVGSVLVDSIQTLAFLASTNAERINLLAGTISHEIGHTLSLDHSLSALANPGAASFDTMATGVSPTFMPNGDRILNRAFGYSQFGQLIDAVGTRAGDEIPEPVSIWLTGAGILFVAGRARFPR